MATIRGRWGKIQAAYRYYDSFAAGSIVSDHPLHETWNWWLDCRFIACRISLRWLPEPDFYAIFILVAWLIWQLLDPLLDRFVYLSYKRWKNLLQDYPTPRKSQFQIILWISQALYSNRHLQSCVWRIWFSCLASVANSRVPSFVWWTRKSRADWVHRPFPRYIVGLYLYTRFKCKALTRKGFEGGILQMQL